MFALDFIASIVLFFYATTAELLPTTGGNCEKIAVCPTFAAKRVKHEPSANISRWIGEADIGKEGSWEGVVPENYRLDLNFVNITHYTGSVEITFRLLRPTRRIIVNHGSTNPLVDYTAVTIRKVCAGTKAVIFAGLPSIMKRSSSDTFTAARCIQSATFLEINETLVLDLQGVLEGGPGVRYVISFPKFQGRSINEEGTEGGKGLHESTSRGSETIADFSSVSTIFQMRYARTAFPCFDHPALKARFALSIERPSRISVASNTRMIESERVGDTGRRRDRFGLTPMISTYVFTFAAMENYTSESKMPGDGEGGPVVEILAPVGTMGRFRWMFDEAIAVVRYMERITKFKFPLDRLAFLVAYPAPFWGVENLGLITVEGGFMQSPETTETAYMILYHEIVHQWLGDVVTLSEWREICLQEGLTTYLEWKISAERRNGSLDDTAQQARKKKVYDRYYEPYALMEYKVTQDIADRCYGRPSFFFHSVAKRFGFEVLERFLARLIENRPYGTANLEMWDKTLDDVTKGQMTPGSMAGYIEGWFRQPGPLYLMVSRLPEQSDSLVLRQYVANSSPRGSPLEVTTARPFPFKITSYKSPSTTLVLDTFMNSKKLLVPHVGSQPFIVDADASTLTRKAYTAGSYRAVLSLLNEEQTAFSENQMDTYMDEFCTVFMDDVLPIPDEPANTKPGDWLNIYDMVKNYSKLATGSTCGCCTRSKEENLKIRTCRRQWNSCCKGLRLSKIVGYNYNFTQDEIWGP